MSKTHPTIRPVPKVPTLKKVFMPPIPVALSLCTQAELMHFIEEMHHASQKILVDNVNIDNLWQAHQNGEYRHYLNHLSSINLVDGVPVRWLARIAGHHVPERLAFTDVAPPLLTFAARNNLKVFIVGSHPDTLARAEAVLAPKNRWPRQTRCWSQPRALLENPQINGEVLAEMADFQPDMLFVALGAPFQTEWIGHNWEALPNSVILSVGGAFDYMAGVVGRAPVWMQHTGTEWLYRLLYDRQKRERSLFERYILNDLPFAFHLAVRIQFNRRLNKHRHQEMVF